MLLPSRRDNTAEDVVIHTPALAGVRHRPSRAPGDPPEDDYGVAGGTLGTIGTTIRTGLPRSAVPL
jgi:hypothetical protein